MKLDEKDKLIIQALIRDPRMSDNNIGKLTKIPIRTVSRKRKKLEQEDKIRYFASPNIKFKSRHLYILKFKMGFTKKIIYDNIKKETKFTSSFTPMIHKSYFAEIDGHTALLLNIEGSSETEISENFNSKIIPLLLKNHGQDSIIDIKTIRISASIRLFHNYLPDINMKHGKLNPNIPLNSIFVDD